VLTAVSGVWLMPEARHTKTANMMETALRARLLLIQNASTEGRAAQCMNPPKTEVS
jgi:hypothetical protein